VVVGARTNSPRVRYNIVYVRPLCKRWTNVEQERIWRIVCILIKCVQEARPFAKLKCHITQIIISRIGGQRNVTRYNIVVRWPEHAVKNIRWIQSKMIHGSTGRTDFHLKCVPSFKIRMRWFIRQIAFKFQKKHILKAFLYMSWIHFRYIDISLMF